MSTSADLLLPEGTRLLHIGPHKTGTTTVQGAFYSSRGALAAQGVHYTGRSRQPLRAAHAVTGRPWHLADGQPPPLGVWRSLVREIKGARTPRVVVSSEGFADADPAAIGLIVSDLDPARVHVAVTLRPLERIIPSQWQQYVQNGMRASFDTWLDMVFNQESPAARTFWRRHRHDELITRWAEVVGPQNLTAIVVDDSDRSQVLRVFEDLLGLHEGTLVADPGRANRSLTLPEIEAVRAFNIAFKAEGLDPVLHSRVMRLGAAHLMKAREPRPDEPRIETPRWARERAAQIADEMVANIAASGVRVVGNLKELTRVPKGRQARDRQPNVCIPPEIAASMAMGVLVATGLARPGRGGASRWSGLVGLGPWVEPPEVARVSTYHLAGAVGLRAFGWVGRRLSRPGIARG